MLKSSHHTGALSQGAPSAFQDQAAYDALPSSIRAAISEGAYCVNCKVLLARHLRGYTEGELLANIMEWRRLAASEAVARGMPRELTGWPPVVARRRRSVRLRRGG